MLILLPQIEALCRKTSAEILSFYGNQSTLTISQKSDNTPLTQADLLAHQQLSSGLAAILPLPVVSEESKDYQPSDDYWLIDPIDGTREFIEQSSNFCICIARICQQRPRFGLIYAPLSGHYWYAQAGAGAYHWDGQQHWRLQVQPRHHRLITARPRISAALKEFAAALLGHDYEHKTKGSALKFCLLAQGDADIYPKLVAATNEWDIASGDIILHEAGGFLRFGDGSLPRYGTKASPLNPPFIACNDAELLQRALALLAKK